MERSLFLAAAGEPHWALVCGLGISVVFLGLALLIGIIELVNLITTKIEGSRKDAGKKEVAVAPAAAVAHATRKQENVPDTIENRDEIVAAVCAAVAEENGTDISAIRVVSFKRV